MQTRQERVRDLRRQNNGASYISKTAVQEYLGVGKDAARTFLQGLEYVPIGQKHMYNVIDIAMRLEETKQIS